MTVSPRDRVSMLLGGRQRKVRHITTPEGVIIDVQVADRSERISAFLVDMLIWLGVTIITVIALWHFLVLGSGIGMTLILFLSFLFRNLYFIHFELAWQGSTPGKWVTGLKVIDRKGGPLTPAAIVARNITREVEFFLPLQLFFTLPVTDGASEMWQTLATLGWVLMLAALPFFNKDHLRAGDLIAGTLVICMPKRSLALDLAESATPGVDFTFTPSQLQVYGAFELQVLEEILRRPPGVETARAQRDVAARIIIRIGYEGKVKEAEAADFLRAFYAAERAELERGQLFGRYRDDKNSGTRRAGEPVK